MTKNYNILFQLILALFIPSYLTAQQLIDEDFINSLPEEIKNDLVNNYNSKQDPESVKKYESFSSKIISSSELSSLSSNLKKFGDDFFTNVPSTFMPINDPSANSGYILDVDDDILIQIIGDRSEEYIYKIDRSGAISIRDIGMINVAGLSIERANKLINEKLKNFFVETEAVISLVAVRDIEVLITGHVNFPGVYMLSGYSNLLHALISAGGISDFGSMRKVTINKNNGRVIEIDLYNIFLNADTANNISLSSGDSILVHPSRNFVPVIGAVPRPAIYEFTEGESVEDLINYSGGITQYSNPEKVFLVNNKKVLSRESALKSFLNVNDRIFVSFNSYKPDEMLIQNGKSFADLPVQILGAINNPGQYYVQPDQTLSDLIGKAGGYTKDAYIFGGMLFNKESAKIENEYNTRLYNEAIKSLSSKAILTKGIDVSSMLNLLAEFKNVNSKGRIISEFDLSKISSMPLLDTVISPGDKIFIPYKNDLIYVFGEVVNPGAIKFKPSYSTKDYIDLTGGYSNSADKKNIIVVQANGEAFKAKSIRNIFSNTEQEILPGAVIYVSRDIDELEGLDLAQVMAPIFSSLAISLASLNSIQNNN